MHKKRPLLLGVASLALLLSSSLLQADPGNGKGNSQNGKNKGHSSDSSYSKEQKNSDYKQNDDDYKQHYDNDVERILRIFTDNQGQYGQVESLPPGIRKNLARGKPLPPGIAKKLDPNFARQLPNYQGYEWRQVGSDAALVNITTGVVREILNDVLR